jgi:hypothetical protein
MGGIYNTAPLLRLAFPMSSGQPERTGQGFEQSRSVRRNDRVPAGGSLGERCNCGGDNGAEAPAVCTDQVSPRLSLD